MTTETTEWSAADSIESAEDVEKYMLVAAMENGGEDFLMAVLSDIANSKWMQQRAKDGKTVVLAGKG